MARAPSLWLDRADEAPAPYPSGRLPTATDVVVVGGGIMGICVAYWLARLGARAIVVESRRLGWGASGRNGGLLLAGGSPLEDPHAIDALLEEEGIDAHLDRCGHLALATSPESVEAIRSEIERRAANATPLELLDRDGCEQLLGRRISPRFLGGRWLPRAALIDPVRLLHGLARAALRRGAMIATGTAALSIEGTRARTTRGLVEAADVVLACGARTATLAPALASALTPMRGQMLATAPMPPTFGVGLALDRGSVYWRQTRAGEIVVGGMRGRDPASERTRREALNPHIQSGLTQFLPEAFPGLGRVDVRGRWAGIMDETTDWRPLVGRVPGSPGQWTISGFGGHGLPAAVGAGRALAESVLSGVPADVLDRLDPGRTIAEEVAC